MRTYGQIVDDKIITYAEFLNEVSRSLKSIGIIKLNPFAIKAQYKKGASIEDAISYLILNSK